MHKNDVNQTHMSQAQKELICKDETIHNLTERISKLEGDLSKLQTLLQEVDFTLRGALMYAGTKWGSPDSVRWVLRGVVEALKEREAFLTVRKNMVDQRGKDLKEQLRLRDALRNARDTLDSALLYEVEE